MPRIADPTQRRLNIIYAVWHQIAFHGLETVTIRQVAAEAGVSIGQVQHYFPTKEQLILESCQAMVQTAEEHYRRSRTSDSRETALQLLTQGLPRTDVSRAAFAVWHSFAARSFADEAIAKLLCEARMGMRRELQTVVEAARGLHGHEVSTSASEATLHLQALADGLALAVFTGDVPLDEAENMLRAALDGILGV